MRYMVDKADIVYKTTDDPASLNSGGQMPAPAPQQAQPEHTKIKGRFDNRASGFWNLALPMLGARYTGRWVSNYFQWDKSSNPLLNKAYGAYVAVVMFATTALYTNSIWGDMKRVFAETLAYEFDKKPQDVGIRDFLKSKNSIVHSTMHNFIKRTTLRGLFANATFLNFLIPGVVVPDGPQSKRGMSIYNAVDLGVGGASAYLASDAIFRKQTFFEALQNFIDHKINHDDNMGQPITASDLTNLYTIQVRDNGQKSAALPSMDTPAWTNDQLLFNRMAELMNETYHNMPAKEHADFTVPKLLYLLGHGVVKAPNLEENLAYIEIANKYGIPAVKQVANDIRSGKKLEEAIRNFPFKLDPTIQESIENQQDGQKFAGRVAEPRNTLRTVAAVPAASFTEKTAKNDNSVATAAL